MNTTETNNTYDTLETLLKQSSPTEISEAIENAIPDDKFLDVLREMSGETEPELIGEWFARVASEIMTEIEDREENEE